MSESKVIFHIDELDKWDLLLKDVSILLDAMKSNDFKIEVLANSEAVKFYDKNSIMEMDKNFMCNLSNKGVCFAACNTSLNSYSMNQNDIVDFVNLVPKGTMELINKQSDGFIYLKAW